MASDQVDGRSRGSSEKSHRSASGLLGDASTSFSPLSGTASSSLHLSPSGSRSRRAGGPRITPRRGSLRTPNRITLRAPLRDLVGHCHRPRGRVASGEAPRAARRSCSRPQSPGEASACSHRRRHRTALPGITARRAAAKTTAAEARDGRLVVIGACVAGTPLWIRYRVRFRRRVRWTAITRERSALAAAYPHVTALEHGRAALTACASAAAVRAAPPCRR
jgi:hypothetical protein